MIRRYLEPFFIALAAFFFWLYSRTWRVAHPNFPHELSRKVPVVYAHWHGDELLLIGAHVRTRMAVMASLSRDGERQRRLLGWLGYTVVRGSSSRGAIAGLKALIAAVTERRLNASLAVDGPRGPIHHVKPGILKLAQATGAPLVAGAGAASRARVFSKAWNRAFLPKAFSKCVVVYSDPCYVSKDLNEDQLEGLRMELEHKLISLKVEAEKLVGRSVLPDSLLEKTRPLKPFEV